MTIPLLPEWILKSFLDILPTVQTAAPLSILPFVRFGNGKTGTAVLYPGCCCPQSIYIISVALRC